jgi:hypothetical protein
MTSESRRQSRRVLRASITKLLTFANWCIAGVAAVIALAFTAYSIKDIGFSEGIRNLSPVSVQGVTLSIYIWCWVVGTRLDAAMHASVYLHDPLEGRMRFGALVAVFFIAIASVVLLITRANELYFALALMAFTTVDILSWRYLLRFLKPIIRTSADKYKQERDYFGLAQLEAFASHIKGNWHSYRQIVLYAVVLSMIIIAVSPDAKRITAKIVGWPFPAIPASSIEALLPNIFLIAFVAVSEFWNFGLRIKTLLTIRAISALETKYQMRPKIS